MQYTFARQPLLTLVLCSCAASVAHAGFAEIVGVIDPVLRGLNVLPRDLEVVPMVALHVPSKAARNDVGIDQVGVRALISATGRLRHDEIF